MCVAQSTVPTTSALARGGTVVSGTPETQHEADRRIGRAVERPACAPVERPERPVGGVALRRASGCTWVFAEPARSPRPSAEAVWRGPGRPRRHLKAGRCRSGPLSGQSRAGRAPVQRAGRSQLWSVLGRARVGKRRALDADLAELSPAMLPLLGGMMPPRPCRRRWPSLELRHAAECHGIDEGGHCSSSGRRARKSHGL